MNVINQKKITVVIPIYNREHTIREVLNAIYTITDVSFEVIAVNDGSTDRTENILKEYPCEIINLKENHGPSYARNLGASKAKGDIIVFIDSDVIIESDTFNKIDEIFSTTSHSALIGVFSEDIRFENFSSHYKNLYMSYQYQNLPDTISNLCSSLAALKKEVFMDIGGYDEKFGIIPCEDMEYGVRIAQKYPIKLCKDLTFEHVKHYNWKQILKTDFERSESIIKILIREKSKASKGTSFQTAPKTFILGVGLSGLSLLFLLGGFLVHPVLFATAMICWILIIFMNLKFIMLIVNKLNNKFKCVTFLKASVMTILDLFVMGVGVVKGLISYVFGKKY